MGLKEWNWKWITRTLHVLGCGAAAFCGVWGYIAEKITFMTILINLYLIVFSAFLFTAEVQVPIRSFQNKFRFLQAFSGRVMTLLFISSLCFVFTRVQNVVVGSYMLVVFCVDVWVWMAMQPDFIREERDRLRESARAAKDSAKATVTSGIAQGVTEAAQEGIDDSTPSWARMGKKDKSKSKPAQTAPPTPTPTAQATPAEESSAPAPTDDTPTWAKSILGHSSTASTATNNPPPAAPQRVNEGVGANEFGDNSGGGAQRQVPAWAAGIESPDPHSNPFR